MKVAIDVQTVLGQPTGYGFYVSNLVSYLEKMDDLQLIKIRPSSEKDFSTPQRLIWDQFTFPRLAKKHQVDLIHQPCFSAPLLYKGPVVVTIQDIIGILFPKNIPFASRMFYSKWVPLSYRKALQIITISNSAKNDIIKILHISEDKITVIPLAVDEKFGDRVSNDQVLKIRKKYKLPEKYILHIGTLEPRKNLGFLIDVFSQVIKDRDFDDLRLVITGKRGWYFEGLFDKVRRLNLEKKVIFNGYFDEEDKPALYKGATIFAFPSLYEGFGLPPLEAMASGVPVISSNTSSMPEVVGKAGILLAPNDTKGWVKSIKEVASNAGLRDKMKTANRAQVAHFSWKETARKTLEVYQKAYEAYANMKHIQKSKKRIIFVSESIRRDNHTPLRFFNRYEVLHFYLKAPYGDLSKDDLNTAKQVKISNLFNEIIKARPDIIQGTEPFGSRLSLSLSYICLIAKIRTGAKLVVSVLENRPIGKRFSLIQRAVLKIFCPKYFRACDAIIALNKGAITNIKYYDKKAKIETGVIWGVWGVDLEMFKPTGIKNSNEIIYVGRIIEDKGLRYLIEGFSKSVKSIPDLRLRIAGSGDLVNELKKYVEENDLTGNVEFIGFVENEKLAEVFSRATLCVYPSITMKRWEEQLGTVNFQALACGTPILTTKSGAIPEYIEEGKGAMLVQEKSSDAIAKALIAYFSNSVFRKKLLDGARDAAKKYDIRVEIKKAQELLDELD